MRVALIIVVALTGIIATKFAFVENEEECLLALEQEGYVFDALAGFEGPKCNIKQPVKLYSTPTTKLETPVTLSCKFARSFGAWASDIHASKITHMGGYNCRKIAGSNFMSQHSYGNAIDISSIDGVSIKDSWQEAAKVACKHFTNVLTPASNAAHHDHLHLDNGMGLPCWGKEMKKNLQNWLGQSE